ncbi:hypothetical protein JCM19301_1090 [Jejuia pallidilutea]|uniref:Uncharacterized protein n=1 Tax=Jejuia pallidilutea TaxID=504487 RepID=A0A090W779_9FLAO|nr:hypothetical protein JCM19301_1090 [Jejuia pallidilutea]GAL72870.1 hypothetical protein JCM19302_1820 [Jejuia pallidilutea]GAL90306.1 hypothetical protein JCM19538_71 [Jejuia pallidilutea]
MNGRVLEKFKRIVIILNLRNVVALVLKLVVIKENVYE